MNHKSESWVVDPADLGRTVRRARRARGLRQDCLAKRLDVSRMTVSRLERGEAVSTDTALRALTECGVVLVEVSNIDQDAVKGNSQDSTPDVDHRYPSVYRDVLFPLLDGVGDPFFDPDKFNAEPVDQLVFDQLIRSGTVVRAGTRWSIGQPHKGLLLFAARELADRSRVRWSDPEVCAPLVESGSLIPGSAEAVLAHYDLKFNPIGTPPITIWHGHGPSTHTPIERDGWLPWVPDGLTRKVPLAVAYADLFCTPGWEAEEFANYVLHRVIPAED